MFVLLTIDTLRADHLGAYGYPRGTSPALDRFAAQAVTFTDCVSVSSWTMPAMGTLATGLRPNEHGMIYWHLPLADVPETMAEVLENAGVTTSFFGNPIPRLPGLDRGFSRWEIFEGDDAAALAAALDWLQETDGRDRFLWLHLLSPHAPYDPRPGTVRAGDGHERTDRYDAEIRTTDLYVDELLARLDGGAAVVVTADHGETLDERSELSYDHGKFLFEELVQIPCFARIPGGAAGIDRDIVRLADVVPTACDWFGVEPPLGSYGTSLLPRLHGARQETAGPTFAFVVEDEPPAAKDRRWSVRGDGMKAVFNLDRGSVRLFDLREDPGETVDVAARFPEEVARRRAALEQWLERMPTPRIPFGQRFTPDELDRLQSLGYLGGAR
jgi:arylsulfatase A-like enzyme